MGSTSQHSSCAWVLVAYVRRVCVCVCVWNAVIRVMERSNTATVFVFPSHPVAPFHLVPGAATAHLLLFFLPLSHCSACLHMSHTVRRESDTVVGVGFAANMQTTNSASAASWNLGVMGQQQCALWQQAAGIAQ